MKKKKILPLVIVTLIIASISLLNLNLDSKISNNFSLKEIFKSAEANAECSPYDIDDAILDQVSCYCENGGYWSEKMDCVDSTGKCCVASQQTTCDCN